MKKYLLFCLIKKMIYPYPFLNDWVNLEYTKEKIFMRKTFLNVFFFLKNISNLKVFIFKL